MFNQMPSKDSQPSTRRLPGSKAIRKVYVGQGPQMRLSRLLPRKSVDEPPGIGHIFHYPDECLSRRVPSSAEFPGRVGHIRPVAG